MTSSRKSVKFVLTQKATESGADVYQTKRGRLKQLQAVVADSRNAMQGTADAAELVLLHAA